MRIGIIIVFHNDEKNIDTGFFIKHLKQAKNAELCLVNNASRDNTSQKLKEIKESSSLANISIVDIKKFKSDISAVRSGARFMFNQFDLNHIGFISTNMLNKNNNIHRLVKAISKNQNDILNYNIKILEKKEMKQTMFQSVFSITEYLEKLKINHNLSFQH
jgi:hypothetical protein